MQEDQITKTLKTKTKCGLTVETIYDNFTSTNLFDSHVVKQGDHPSRISIALTAHKLIKMKAIENVNVNHLNQSIEDAVKALTLIHLVVYESLPYEHYKVATPYDIAQRVSKPLK